MSSISKFLILRERHGQGEGRGKNINIITPTSKSKTCSVCQTTQNVQALK